eukprot:754067-Hanusia_phi.AAC.1
MSKEGEAKRGRERGGGRGGERRGGSAVAAKCRGHSRLGLLTPGRPARKSPDSRRGAANRTRPTQQAESPESVRRCRGHVRSPSLSLSEKWPDSS